MAEGNPGTHPSAGFRAQAEERLREAWARATPAGATEPDQKRLVYELQVYQIELEMQNDELNRLQDELEASRTAWEDLFEFAPVGYCTLDGDGTILQLNLAGASLLGAPRSHLPGKRLALYLAEASRLAFSDFFAEVLAGRPARPCEVVVLREGAEPTILTLGGTVERAGSTGRITMTDVTERKRVEIALQKSEDDFRYIFEKSIVGMTITSPSGESHVNDAFARMLGYEREELERLDQRGLTHPDDLAESQRVVASFLSGESNEAHFVKRYMHRDGSVVWAEVSTNVRRDADGSPLYFVTVASDITERRRLEAALNEAVTTATARAVELQALMDAVPAIVFVAHDPACERMTISRAGEQMLGMRTGANASVSAPEEERPATFRSVKDGREVPPEELPVQMAAQGQPVRDAEVRLEMSDGTTRVIVGDAVPLFDATGGVRGAVGAFRDVTEQRRAEEALSQHRDHMEEVVAERTASLLKANAALKEVIAAHCRTEKELRESEERLDLAQEASQSGTFEWDVRTNEVLWTPGLERLYGLTAEGLAGGYASWETFVHPEDLPRINAVARKAVEERTGLRSEFRITRGDGETRWLEVSGRVFCDETGQPLKFIGVNWDITDRKAAEEGMVRASAEALRRSEETYRGLF